MKRPKSKKKLGKNEGLFIQQQQSQQWCKEEIEDVPKWVTHYCSDHQILLVGDGDFSFSLSLAKAFGSAANVVASSLDTYDEVTKKYKNAKSNLDELQKLGAYLLHGVDATQMKFNPDLKMRKFDRIIFNFPHAGFYGKEDNMLMIKMHMDLVLGFFKNASHMLRANGEIHVNHKTTPPFNNWNIEKLAEQSFLIMIECSEFKKEHYPGYNNKRGDSYRCDDPFPLGKCSTFKFINNPRNMKNHMRVNHTEVRQQMTNLPFHEIVNMERIPAPVDLNHHPRIPLHDIHNMPHFPAPVDLNHHPRLPLHDIHYMPHSPAPVDLNHHPRLPLHDIHNMPHFPAPVDVNYHPQTRLLPFEKTQHMEQFPAQVNLNYHRQTSLFPKPNQPDFYPPRSHFPKVNQPMRSEYDLRNGYNTTSRDYITNLTEIHGRVSSFADCYHYGRDTTQDTRPLQSLQQWPAPTNCQYSLTEQPLRRTMDIYQGVESSSSYLRDVYRNAEQPSYCFDKTRLDYFERWNAEVVPRRNVSSEIYVMQ